MKQEETHLVLDQDQLRAKCQSTGDFEPAAACGNGSYHFKRTTITAKVDCPKCLAIIKANPAYLSA